MFCIYNAAIVVSSGKKEPSFPNLLLRLSRLSRQESEYNYPAETIYHKAKERELHSRRSEPLEGALIGEREVSRQILGTTA